MRIAFVGCGAAGRPLGAAWRGKGHSIGAVRTRSTAADAVGVMGEGTPGGSLADADVVVFATPDDALAGVAREHALSATQVALRLWEKTEPTVRLTELEATVAVTLNSFTQSQLDAETAAQQVGSGTLLLRDEYGRGRYHSGVFRKR